MLQESSHLVVDALGGFFFRGEESSSRVHPSTALITHSLPTPTSCDHFLPCNSKTSVTSYSQGKNIWEEWIRSRADIRKCLAVPSQRWDQAAIATDTLGEARKGDRTSATCISRSFVSKLAALTLTGCQLFLPGLRKEGIKGFLWPPSLVLSYWGEVPPHLAWKKCFTDRFQDDSLPLSLCPLSRSPHGDTHSE